jgi:protein gp37
MNRTKIEWNNPKEGWSLDYTLNPMVGCKHGCEFCYAKRLNERFKWIEKWNEPKTFFSRLQEPGKVNKPSTIFVGSMCDLFGSWVDDFIICRTIEMCKKNPHHRFMFLTKNPKRYLLFDFPENCWLGATMMDGRKINPLLELKSLNPMNKTFMSIEPIMGPFHGINLSFLDLVIVGAMTGPGAVVPQKHWISSIQHNNICWKDNIKKYL